MHLRYLLLPGVISLAMSLYGQSTFNLEIGKPYPNASLLHIQSEEGNKVVSLADYRGLPLIVDFFSSSCVVCFKSLPKINRMQEKFKDKMRFLLIGKEDAVIRKVYAKFREQLQLKLAIAYDSILHRDLRDRSYPLYVWIDAVGIVRAVTGVEELTESRVEAFISRQPLPQAPPKVISNFNPSKPFLINGNGGVDSIFISRSLFSYWDRSKPLSLPRVIDYTTNTGSLQLLGVRVNDLYQYAYFGESGWGSSSPLYPSVFPYAILDDGTILFPKTDSIFYCYSLWVSPTQRNYSVLQQRFQADLENQFGFAASIEYRLMPYHRITIREGYEKKLLSLSDSTKSKVTHAGFSLQRSKVSRIVGILANKFQANLPFLDESGLQEPIDIAIDVMMTDLGAVKKALYEKGIQVDLSVKPMRVIVLRSKFINVAAK